MHYFVLNSTKFRNNFNSRSACAGSAVLQTYWMQNRHYVKSSRYVLKFIEQVDKWASFHAEGSSLCEIKLGVRT